MKTSYSESESPYYKTRGATKKKETTGTVEPQLPVDQTGMANDVLATDNSQIEVDAATINDSFSVEDGLRNIMGLAADNTVPILGDKDEEKDTFGTSEPNETNHNDEEKEAKGTNDFNHLSAEYVHPLFLQEPFHLKHIRVNDDSVARFSSEWYNS
jgi:hypothetical protein